MAIEIAVNPIISGSGKESDILFANNPTGLILQRKDATFAAITDEGDEIGVVTNIAYATLDARVSVGDVVYIRSATGLYDDIAEVSNVANNGGNGELTLTLPYRGDDSGFVNFNTSYENYKVVLELYVLREGLSLPEDFNIATVSVSSAPDERGVIPIDFGEIARSHTEFVVPTITIEEGVVFYRSVVIGFVSTTSKISYFDAVGDELQNIGISFEARFVLGGNQIPSEHGSNAIEYLCNTTDDRGTFLVTTNKLTAWDGWPCYVAWLTDPSDISSVTMALYADNNDLSLVFFGNLSYTGSYLNLFILPESSFFAKWKSAEIYLANDEETSDLYSQKLRVDQIEPICGSDQSVMLMCRNRLGGILQWLFDGAYEIENAVENGMKFQRITCGAIGLSLDEFEALHDFAPSTEDFVLIDDSDFSNATGNMYTPSNPVWRVYPDDTRIQVFVEDTRPVANTAHNRHYFEVTFRMPFKYV